MKKTLSIILSFFVFSLSYAFDYKKLYHYLVDLEGWEGSEPYGEYTKTFMGEMLKIQRNYKKDNQSLKVEVLKGSVVTMMWMPFSMVIEQDTPDRYLKTLEIEGFKSAVEHNKKTDSGKIIVMITPNAAFLLEYTGIKDYNQAISIVKKFPLKDLSMKLM